MGLDIELDAAIIGHQNETTMRYDLANGLRRSMQRLQKIGAAINNKDTKENKALMELREKLNTLDIICTTADKGADMVLLDRSEYIEKTQIFLNENNYETIKKKTYIKNNQKVDFV